MRVTGDEKKQILLAEFGAGRQRLLNTAALIPLDKQDQPFVGVWAIKDLLAHMIGWDYSNIEAAQSVREGKLPPFYDFIDKDWRFYNARLVSLYKKDNLADLIRDACVSQQALLDLLAALPASDLFHDYGVRYRGYRVTIARLVEADAKDEAIHLEQVKNFIAQLNQATAAHIRGA